jgi:hypothetical protein
LSNPESKWCPNLNFCCTSDYTTSKNKKGSSPWNQNTHFGLITLQIGGNTGMCSLLPLAATVMDTPQIINFSTCVSHMDYMIDNIVATNKEFD